jgi:hypothetical protein
MTCTAMTESTHAGQGAATEACIIGAKTITLARPRSWADLIDDEDDDAEGFIMPWLTSVPAAAVKNDHTIVFSAAALDEVPAYSCADMSDNEDEEAEVLVAPWLTNVTTTATPDDHTVPAQATVLANTMAYSWSDMTAEDEEFEMMPRLTGAQILTLLKCASGQYYEEVACTTGDKTVCSGAAAHLRDARSELKAYLVSLDNVELADKIWATEHFVHVTRPCIDPPERRKKAGPRSASFWLDDGISRATAADELESTSQGGAKDCAFAQTTRNWADSDEEDIDDWDKPEWLVTLLERQREALPLQETCVMPGLSLNEEPVPVTAASLVDDSVRLTETCNGLSPVKTSRWADFDEDDNDNDDEWEKPDWLLALLETQQETSPPQERSSADKPCLIAEVTRVPESMPLRPLVLKTEVCAKSSPAKTHRWADSDEDDEEDWAKPEWLLALLEMQQKASSAHEKCPMEEPCPIAVASLGPESTPLQVIKLSTEVCGETSPVKDSRWDDSDEDNEDDWEKPDWLVTLLDEQQTALQFHEESSSDELCPVAEVTLVSESMPLQVMDLKTESCGKLEPFKGSRWTDSDHDDEEEWDKQKWLVPFLEIQQKALPLQNARASTEACLAVESSLLSESWARLDKTAATVCNDFNSDLVSSCREAVTHLDDARNRLHEYMTSLGDAANDRRLRALESPLVVLEMVIAEDLRKPVGYRSPFKSKLEDCLEEEDEEDDQEVEDQNENEGADDHADKYDHEDKHEYKYEDEDEDDDGDKDEDEDENDHDHDHDHGEEGIREEVQIGHGEMGLEATTQTADVSEITGDVCLETSLYLAYYGYEAGDFLAQARCQLHNHMTRLGRSNYERKLSALEYPHIVLELPQWEARPKAARLRGALHWLDDGRGEVSSSRREAPQSKRSTKGTKA